MNKKEKVHKHFPLILMKSSTVWHGHSTRPSLPAGTARKAERSLPRGRRNRLITPPAKRNRAFPTGNALLYISLSYVDFGRVRPIQEAHLSCLFSPPIILTAYSCRKNRVNLTQFLRSSSCGSSCKITLGIFQGLFQKFLQLIRLYIFIPWLGLSEIRYSRMERREECTLPLNIIFVAHGTQMVDPP